MEVLKYKIIKSKLQYNTYCKALEALIFSESSNKAVKDEIELLTLLIEKWDAAHNTFSELDPIELLKSLMTERNMKSKDLADALDIGKSYASEILHYKKGLSKDVVRKLAALFKMNQEAFNRPYKLNEAENMDTKKELNLI